ncbi:hypothetical protein D3C87_1641240 [compost metagenome]
MFENADNHLRIVATGNRREDLFGNFQNKATICHRAGGGLLDQWLALGGLGINESADFPSEFQRVYDELQAFGHEDPGRFAVLLVGKRLDILDDRVGERGNFLHLPDLAGTRLSEFVCHWETQRLKSEVDRARPRALPSIPVSRMTSSPDSTVPPAPRIVSRISSWME